MPGVEQLSNNRGPDESGGSGNEHAKFCRHVAVIASPEERCEPWPYGISGTVSLNDDDLRRGELRMLLREWRARLKPSDVGLPSVSRRRVPGLRREEVAALAGVGLTWYTMFETGATAGVSNDLVERIADALRLSAGERMHLQSLATRVSLRWTDAVADPLLMEVVRDWVDAPAYVVTYTWDVVAWNAAYSYVWDIESPGSPPFNLALRLFSEDGLQKIAGASWPALAQALVGMFRLTWGRHLRDERYAKLLSDLRAIPAFERLWESHDVEHPLVDLTVAVDSPNAGRFTYRVLNLNLMEPFQTLVVQVPVGEMAKRVREILRSVVS
jgi:transcriptional regulator with XRE-family HTH domain